MSCSPPARERACALLSLPTDVLHHILRHLHFGALCALSETSTALHRLATHNATWRHLAQRRFRLSHHRTAAAAVCWRSRFCHWHAQRRMPASRTTGVAFRSFARCDARRGVRAWLCVCSADDCRLRAGGALRVRLVLQNIAHRALRVQPRRVRARLCDGGELRVRDAPSRSLRIARVSVERCAPAPRERERELAHELQLALDEFAVLCMDIRMADAEFEVDVLERLQHVSVPIACDSHGSSSVRATLMHKQLWDAYQPLPGGCWLRRA